MYPQSIVVWVNLFAFGGLESAFLWPVVLGLFWPRMNACGAMAGVFGGLGLYTLAMATGFHFYHFHNIVIGTAAGAPFLGDRKLLRNPHAAIREGGLLPA